MNPRVSAAILGASDGAVSISGVIAGGASAHVSHHALGLAAIGGALAATVSMAGAELVSEDKTDWGSVLAMGSGTLLGSAFPAFPLLALSGNAAWIVVAFVALLIGVAVGVVRSRVTKHRLVTSLGVTLLILAIGAGVGFGAGLL